MIYDSILCVKVSVINTTKLFTFSDTSKKFSFSEISQTDVLDTLQSLNGSHAFDTYKINMIFFKIQASTLLPLFHHLLNLCIVQSIFPDAWKFDQITPIFQSGDPTEVSNYQPISVLPIFSKSLEKKNI